MKRVHAKHLPYDNGHLGKVVQDMQVAGAPTIRVMRMNGELYATEGSHRLASAHHLGEIPKLVVEIEETTHLPDEHWMRVSETLPVYDFEHILLLDLKSFQDKTT